jgi:hypothetical protein
MGQYDMDKLYFEVTKMDMDRVRVEVYYKISETLKEFMGIMYYEKAKKSFNRKPVGMDAWACVDAKVEGLYTKDESITPKQIVGEGYNQIKLAGF